MRTGTSSISVLLIHTPTSAPPRPLLKLRKFGEARAQAVFAVGVAPETDGPSRAAAHELLARIALARRDVDAAREEAALAQEAVPALPLPTFIEARILYDEGKYADALPLFQQTILATEPFSWLADWRAALLLPPIPLAASNGTPRRSRNSWRS